MCSRSDKATSLALGPMCRLAWRLRGLTQRTRRTIPAREPRYTLERADFTLLHPFCSDINLPQSLAEVIGHTRSVMANPSMSSLTTISGLILLPRIVYTAADSKCYLRNGEYDAISQPCDPDTEVGHCCQKNLHICLSNKLCFDAQFNHVIEGPLMPSRQVAAC